MNRFLLWVWQCDDADGDDTLMLPLIPSTTGQLDTVAYTFSTCPCNTGGNLNRKPNFITTVNPATMIQIMAI